MIAQVIIENGVKKIIPLTADAEADLANLTVGQIVATKDTGEEIELKKQIKEIVSASTDFADFKTKIAEW